MGIFASEIKKAKEIHYFGKLSGKKDIQQIDLMDIPAKRRQLALVSLNSTLQNALEIMNREGVEALYDMTRLDKSVDRINDITTAKYIEKQFRFVGN